MRDGFGIPGMVAHDLQLFQMGAILFPLQQVQAEAR